MRTVKTSTRVIPVSVKKEICCMCEIMLVNIDVCLPAFVFSCARSSNKNIVRDTQVLTEAQSERKLVVLSHSDRASLHDNAIRYDPADRIVSDAQDNPFFEGHMVLRLSETTDKFVFCRATFHICTRKSSGRKGKRWNDIALDVQSFGISFYTTPYTTPQPEFPGCEKGVM